MFEMPKSAKKANFVSGKKTEFAADLTVKKAEVATPFGGGGGVRNMFPVCARKTQNSSEHEV